MPDVNVNADLLVEDGAGSRQLSVDDLKAPATGDATEATLAAVLLELGEKLSPADIAALATAAKQDAAKIVLDAILAAVIAPLSIDNFPATQPVSGPLTDAQLRALAVAVSGTIALDAPTLAALETITIANPTANPETGLAKDATFTSRTPALVGEWDYHAGISGTAVIPSGERVIGIAAHATGGGASLAINGGGSVPIPANSGLSIAPIGNLVAPTIVFTATDSFFIETVS